MFQKEFVPPALWDAAEALNTQESNLLEEIKKAQEGCKHSWEKIMAYDKNYCPRVDGRDMGQDVIVGFRCTICNTTKPINGTAYQTCRKCGGEMKYDGRTHYGDIPVHVHKCKKCGHEYDTT